MMAYRASTHRNTRWGMQTMRNVSEGNTMRKYSANGFTLMELMITVVIIGILASIAYPSYTRYVAETRRSDATINLTRIAALQEKFFTQCGVYAIALDTPLACGPNPPNPPRSLISGLTAGVTTDGYYTLTAALGVASDGGYLLTAAPAGTQATADATKCTNLTINATGKKTAAGTDGNLTNGGKCWKK